MAMSSRRPLKSVSLIPRSAGKASYQRQRQMVRQQPRISRSEWELAASAMRQPAYFSASGAEIKAIDIASASYLFRNVATASNIILLNGVQTGSGFFNRVGSRIEMKSIHIRGQIVNAVTAISGGIRMLLIYDRQPNGALPVISDILQSRDQAGTAATSGVSEINLDQRDRFMILRDTKLYTPSVTNTAGVLTNGPQFPGVDSMFDIDQFIKLKGLTTHYSGTANPVTIANINTGGLYAAFLTSTGGNDSCWQFTGGYRLRYNDK